MSILLIVFLSLPLLLLGWDRSHSSAWSSALRLPASLPAFSPFASLRVGSPIIERRSSPCFAFGVPSPLALLHPSRRFARGLRSWASLLSSLRRLVSPLCRRHVAAAATATQPPRRRFAIASWRRSGLAASLFSAASPFASSFWRRGGSIDFGSSALLLYAVYANCH